MTGRRNLKPSDGEHDPSLEQLVDDLIERLQAGDEVDLEAVIREHPDHAEPIRRMVPALEALVDFGETSAPSDGRRPGRTQEVGTPAKVLGDFRLLQEIGRGGMGIVYEAEQVSLGRRVALKLLPMAAALDPRQIQRFRVEAQAAACLHHPHIVPVHGVGCERGVHYYAMQLIEGQSLAAMISELRRLDGLDPPSGPDPGLVAISTTNLATRLLSGGAGDRRDDGGPGSRRDPGCFQPRRDRIPDAGDRARQDCGVIHPQRRLRPRRGPPDAPGRSGAGPRPRARHPPPRHQAGQPLA